MNGVRKKINYSYAEQIGITGKGIGTAILDTGIYPHSDFSNRIIGFKDFVRHKERLYDDNSHGTHVAGIIAGSGALSKGKFKGVAPGSNILAIKVLDEKGNGDTETVLEALEYVIARKEEYQIRIVNISVGTHNKTGPEEVSILVEAVEHAWDEGLVVVVAAGNNGPDPHSITTPGISKKVITIGSVDDNAEKDFLGRVRFNYSGRGPTQSCICKPELVAPGFQITSCNAPIRRNTKPYAIKSGTSMSTPIVSGAIALLLEKYPDMTNVEVKMKLRESAVNLGLPKNRQGWGMLDVALLLKD